MNFGKMAYFIAYGFIKAIRTLGLKKAILSHPHFRSVLVHGHIDNKVTRDGRSCLQQNSCRKYPCWGPEKLMTERWDWKHASSCGERVEVEHSDLDRFSPGKYDFRPLSPLPFFPAHFGSHEFNGNMHIVPAHDPRDVRSSRGCSHQVCVVP